MKTSIIILIILCCTSVYGQEMIVQSQEFLPEPYFRPVFESLGDMQAAHDLELHTYYVVIDPAGIDLYNDSIFSMQEYPDVIFFGTLQLDDDHAVLPNDEHLTLLYQHYNNGNSGGVLDADMDTFEAWREFTPLQEITVGVIDSGIYSDHEDLRDNVVSGWNFARDNNDTHDYLWHGTHIAGIIGAVGNNRLGVIGVQPYAKLMPLRINSAADAAQALVYAADHGVAVASMSFGTTDNLPLLASAVTYAHGRGVVLVAAMGNSGVASPVYYPAAYPEVIAVGSTNNKDEVTNGSSRGNHISVSAPGAAIYSTETVAPHHDGDYIYGSGTSMAAPQVSGIAAMLLAANPQLSNQQIRHILETTAEDKGDPGFDPSYGYGRVNADQALELAFRYPLIR